MFPIYYYYSPCSSRHTHYWVIKIRIVFHRTSSVRAYTCSYLLHAIVGIIIFACPEQCPENVHRCGGGATESLLCSLQSLLYSNLVLQSVEISLSLTHKLDTRILLQDIDTMEHQHNEQSMRSKGISINKDEPSILGMMIQ